MRKLFIIASYTIYLIFILGFFLHTSNHPQIFFKYTYNYFALLIFLLVFFPFYLWIVVFISKNNKVKITNKVYPFSFLQKLLILLTFLCLFVVLPSEIYLRYKYGNFESITYQYSINSFHPFLQFQLADNYASPINSAGFRSAEIKEKKPEGTYRVFVLGGSTVLNRETDFEKSGVRLLEKHLQSHYPNKKIEVINAGNDGYTSEHSIIQYLFKIKNFQPDMIIMWQGINDWYYSCSPVQRAKGSFKSDYSHFFGAEAAMALNHFQPQPLINIKILTYDFFMKFLQDNWYSDILQVYKKNHPFKGYYGSGSKGDQYELTVSPSISSYKRNLQSFIDILMADGVTVIMGDQPFLYSKNLSQDAMNKIYFPVLHCSKGGKYPSLASVIKTVSMFNQATKMAAEENNIPFISLEASIPKTSEYFTDDVHYTEKGNDRVASTLFKYIVSGEFIDNK